MPVTTPIKDAMDAINLSSAFGEMMSGAGSILGDVLPLGIGLLLLISVPKIVRRIVGAFI